MKIIQIIPSLSIGGAEILTKDLTIELSKKIDIEIWALAYGKDKVFEENIKSQLKDYNIKFKCYGKAPSKDRFKTVLKLRDDLKLCKADIINCHLENVTFYTVMGNLFSDKIIIQTIHNTKIYYPGLQKFMKKFIQKYISISEKVEAVWREKIRIPENKINRIHNGINIEKFIVKDRRIKEKVTNIVAIGRLEPQKDHHTLLHAFRELIVLLKKDNINIPVLNIVGDGSLKNDLIILAEKLNISDRVNFPGNRNNIPDILTGSDLYIMSSKWEGLSISLIEAAASGIPIIATNVGSNDEIICNNKNGYLIEPENPEILAYKMYNLIIDKRRREKFSMNIQKDIRKFDIKNTAEKYLELYKYLVK